MAKATDQGASAPTGDQPGTEPSERVETPLKVEWPTVGRFVQFRIDVAGGDPVLRPALVLDRLTAGGALSLQVFLSPFDVPYAPGTGLAVSTTLGLGGFYASAAFGPECGEWRWPEHGEPTYFEV